MAHPRWRPTPSPGRPEAGSEDTSARRTGRPGLRVVAPTLAPDTRVPLRAPVPTRPAAASGTPRTLVVHQRGLGPKTRPRGPPAPLLADTPVRDHGPWTLVRVDLRNVGLSTSPFRNPPASGSRSRPGADRDVRSRIPRPFQGFLHPGCKFSSGSLRRSRTTHDRRRPTRRYLEGDGSPQPIPSPPPDG